MVLLMNRRLRFVLPYSGSTAQPAAHAGEPMQPRSAQRRHGSTVTGPGGPCAVTALPAMRVRSPRASPLDVPHWSARLSLRRRRLGGDDVAALDCPLEL